MTLLFLFYKKAQRSKQKNVLHSLIPDSFNEQSVRLKEMYL